MTWGEPGAAGGSGGGDERAGVIGTCEEHPSVITVARTAVQRTAPAPNFDLNARTGIHTQAGVEYFELYRITVLAVRNPVIP